MTESEVRDRVVDILHYIAPDEDVSGIDDAQPLRDQLGLDSMDFVDIVLELRKRHGITIPEDDYGKLLDMNSIVSYLTPLFQEKAKA
jgi:acyl carrier protein